MAEILKKIVVDHKTGGQISEWLLIQGRTVYQLLCPDLSCIAEFFSPNRESNCPSHTIPYKGILQSVIRNIRDVEITPKPERSEKLYRRLASIVQAYHNCVESGNEEWKLKHKDEAERLTKDLMPCGSGFDSGTILATEASSSERLVFNTSFHHMDEGGGYDGWTEHIVTVGPSLVSGFNLHISGRDRNEIKDYIHEMFGAALDSVVEW